MYVAALTLDVLLGDVHSLKGKRGVVRPLVAELRRRYPEWRFGQLIANVAGWADQEIWDVEDEQLLAAAQAHLEQRGQGKRNLPVEPTVAADRAG